MAETTNLLLQRFKAKRAEKNSVSLQEARRMVNLYRSLSCFGDEFVDTYNQMLLGIKPNVRRLLGTFMGGEEVGEYLEFLEQNAHLDQSEDEQKETDMIPNKGYLPTPEADIGVPGLSKDAEKITISKTEWEKMKVQKETLMEQIQSLLVRLESMETGTLPGLSEKISAESPKQDQKSNVAFNNYSEIIEDSSGDKNHE